MMKSKPILISFLMIITIICLYQSQINSQYTKTYQQSDKIPLRSIQTLTLYKDSVTKSRKNKVYPQLVCIGGDAQNDKYKPDVVQCKNQGSNGESIQWKCESDLDDRYRFGKTNIVCEGYDKPGDSNVVKGSCSCEYELYYTSKGKRDSRNQRTFSRDSGRRESYFSHYSDNLGDDSMFQVLKSYFPIVVVFGVLGVVMLFLFLWGNKEESNQAPTAGTNARGSSRYSRRRHTSNMYPNVDPFPSAPAYESNNFDTYDDTYDNNFNSYPSSGHPKRSSYSSGTGSGLGSFATGAATGAAATYFAMRNNSSNNDNHLNQQRYNQYESRPTYEAENTFKPIDTDSGSTTRKATGYGESFTR